MKNLKAVNEEIFTLNIFFVCEMVGIYILTKELIYIYGLLTKLVRSRWLNIGHAR